jgi:hypothetical protein
MALRPRAEEIIRGIERSLMEQVLPEVKTPYAAAQIHYAVLLLHTLKTESDGAASRLVEDNASLRSFAARAADALQAVDPALATELRGAAEETDADLRLHTLGDSNDRLRALHGRVLAACASARDGSLAGLEREARAQLHEGVRRRMAGALRPR